KLIYLNEKCKEYHDDYISHKKSNPHNASSILADLDSEGIIPENTARRISNKIKPDYETINLSE
ncbi:hypothetical protein, partial [Chromohalobacter sp. 296-RDG]|uniref:hypothetical protein n=1 Tax=Chromohalobacter sp. 296-RDG TaxID=2994062 RepID=UPI00246937DD